MRQKTYVPRGVERAGFLCLLLMPYEWGVSFFLCSQHVPFEFSMGSHQVLNMFCMFPICSPSVFPIAPRFNPICFAQSSPLLIYIAWPKESALHLSKEFSILVSLHSFDKKIKSQRTNQIGSSPKINKIAVVRHPQLINMKQNKYPYMKTRVIVSV